jgi:hypothetical protein
MASYKGKDYDAELKKHGVTLDRSKPPAKGRELNAEAIGDDDGKMDKAQIRRVTGRK